MRLENIVKSTAGNTVYSGCPFQTVFSLKKQIDIIDLAVAGRIRLFSNFFKKGAEDVKTT